MLRIGKKRNENQGLYRMIFRSSMIVMLLAVVLGIAGCGSDDPLPNVNDFESRLTEVVTKYYEGFGVDAKKEGYLPRDYEIKTQKDGKDGIICKYGPGYVLTATGHDGTVEQIFTAAIFKKKLSKKQLGEVMSQLMIPAGLVNSDYIAPENQAKLLEDITQNGTVTGNDVAESAVLEKDGIVYSIFIANGGGITFTIEVQDDAQADASSSTAKKADSEATLEKAVSGEESVAAEFNRVAAGLWCDEDSAKCDMYGGVKDKYYYFTDGEYGCGSNPFNNDHKLEAIGKIYKNNDGSYSISTWNEYGHELNERLYFIQNAFFVMDDPEQVFVYRGASLADKEKKERPFISEYTSTQLASQTWRSEYGKILDFFGVARGWTNTPHIPYSLYDVNGDGIPEMFLCIGTNPGDHRDIMLTIDLPTGKARYIAALWKGHSDIYVSSEPNSFLRRYKDESGRTPIKYKIEENRLVEEGIPSQEWGNYENWKPIRSYQTSDRSGLNWNGNNAN